MRIASLRRLGAGCLGSLGLLAVACGDGASESDASDDGEGGSPSVEASTATSGGSGAGAPVTSGGPTASATSSSTSSGTGGEAPTCDGDDALVSGEPFVQAAFPAGGYVHLVAATPDVVVASTGEALHRSTDGGDTWQLVDAAELRDTSIQSVVARGDELFVSTWESVIRSQDGGVTWQDVSGPDGVAPGYMSVHDGQLFATWSGRPMRWDEGAEAWLALPIGQHTFFDTIECDGHFVYANAIYEAGVFRISLAEAMVVPPEPEPEDPNDPGEVDELGPWTRVVGLSEWGYRAFGFRDGLDFAANDEHIFESTDAGETWSIVDLDEAVRVADLLVLGDAVYAATDKGLVTRQANGDGGFEWTTTSMGWFDAGTALATDGTRVFAASDGLHRRSSPTGAWDVAPLRADTIWTLVAAGDALLVPTLAGVNRSTDGGATWSVVALPEGQSLGYRDAVTQGDELLFLGNQAVLVTDDGGASFRTRSLTPVAGTRWVNFLDEVDGDLVIGVSRAVGTNCSDASSTTTVLHRSSDGGETWTEAFGPLPDTFTDCYGRSSPPMVTSVTRIGGALLAATSWEGLYRSVDDGATWSTVELDEDFVGMQEFKVVGDVIVGIAGYGGGLARSVDDGATWQSAGLDDHWVHDLVLADGTLFAATSNPIEDSSILYSVDAGATWAPVDADFHAETMALAILDDQLFAGTRYASVWSTSLACAPAD